MGNNTQIYRDSADKLIPALPELVELETIQQYSDILIYKGLKRLGNIIDQTEKDEIVIKSVNSLANIGRYLEGRKEGSKSIRQAVEYDDPDMMLNVGDEDG